MMEQRMLCAECVSLDYILLEQEAPVRNILGARTAHGYSPMFDKQLSRLNKGRIIPNDNGFHMIDTNGGHLPCILESEAGLKPNDLLEFIDEKGVIYYTLTTRFFYDDKANIHVWKILKSK